MPETRIKNLKELNLKSKNVFMRVDFNVPTKNGKILDSYRIDKAFPSIKHILDQGGKLVLASHMGRPQGKVLEDLSLRPIGEYLTEKYNLEVLFVEDLESDTPRQLLASLQKSQVVLLENLRFHPGERDCDHSFAKKLAAYTDVYINEGFAISHRSHASTVTLAEMISEKGAGFQLQKEIEHLDKIRLGEIEKPFSVILGGSKVADKIPLLESFIDQTDNFFIGGMMAYTFLKAKDINVGDSYVETGYVSRLKKFIERLESRGKKIWLPEDHIIAKGADVQTTKGENISDGYKGMDIGPKTQKLFTEKLANSKSIFWNGPMGYFEKEEFNGGTKAIAQALSEYTQSYRVVGGGHSALAIRDYESSINHVSTGGGASLAYVQNKVLPGLKSIAVRV